mmetsp:Transcript_5525/g.15559  ORF Transcript_5525/g.15559 Transcript_5525/m.15559 type:complete len:250 (-) Transcript_5525:581-1330(-)
MHEGTVVDQGGCEFGPHRDQPRSSPGWSPGRFATVDGTVGSPGRAAEQDHCQLEKAQIHQGKGHQIRPGPTRSLLRSATRQEGGRPDQGDARQRRLENDTLQTVQFGHARRTRPRRVPASPAQGAGGISQNSPANGLWRNAHQQVGGKQLLEFRFPLSTAVPSGPGCARYLFYPRAGGHGGRARAVLRKGQGDARNGRHVRFDRISLRFSTGRGHEEPIAYPHHGRFFANVVQTGPPGRRLQTPTILFH